MHDRVSLCVCVCGVQATKEEKIEMYLKVLEDRWAVIEWGMDPYKDTDVTLLKVGRGGGQTSGG